MIATTNFAQSKLYEVRRKRDLACLLGISKSSMIELSKTPHDKMYKTLWSPKKGNGKWLKKEPTKGEYRKIDDPCKKIKKIQRKIHDLLSEIPMPECVFAPAKGKSYVDNAKYHIDSKEFHLLDIKSYYPNCKAYKVKYFFNNFMKCPPDIAAILTHLTTFNGCLPQGAPSSPVLSYYSNIGMWKKIFTFIEGEGIRISVYADDITLSGENMRKDAGWEVKKIIHNHGFNISSEKEFKFRNKPALITGVVAKNGNITPRNKHIRALHNLKLQLTHLKNDPKIQAQILGYKNQIKQVRSKAI